MACINYTLSGVNEIGCYSEWSGLKEIYILDHTQFASATHSNSMITGITLTGTASQFVTYKLDKNTSGEVTNLTKDVNNKRASFSSDITVKLLTTSVASRIEFQSLAMLGLAVITRNNEDDFTFYGLDFPVDMTTGAINGGVNLTDPSSIDFTLNDLSKNIPMRVDKTILPALLDGNQKAIV